MIGPRSEQNSLQTRPTEFTNLRAEAAYSGDFLEEDLYEEWAIGPREHARATS
jgi:hypothetical protein